jgi:hypothetical protein
MNPIIKKLGIAGLVLGVSMAAITPLTNTSAYFIAKERLAQYGTVDHAIDAHKKEFVVSGIPFDQIHSIFYGIGEKVAYKLHDDKVEME